MSVVAAARWFALTALVAGCGVAMETSSQRHGAGAGAAADRGIDGAASDAAAQVPGSGSDATKRPPASASASAAASADPAAATLELTASAVVADRRAFSVRLEALSDDGKPALRAVALADELKQPWAVKLPAGRYDLRLVAIDVLNGRIGEAVRRGVELKAGEKQGVAFAAEDLVVDRNALRRGTRSPEAVAAVAASNDHMGSIGAMLWLTVDNSTPARPGECRQAEVSLRQASGNYDALVTDRELSYFLDLAFAHYGGSNGVFVGVHQDPTCADAPIHDMTEALRYPAGAASARIGLRALSAPYPQVLYLTTTYPGYRTSNFRVAAATSLRLEGLGSRLPLGGCTPFDLSLEGTPPGPAGAPLRVVRMPADRPQVTVNEAAVTIHADPACAKDAVKAFELPPGGKLRLFLRAHEPVLRAPVQLAVGEETIGAGEHLFARNELDVLSITTGGETFAVSSARVTGAAGACVAVDLGLPAGGRLDRLQAELGTPRPRAITADPEAAYNNNDALVLYADADCAAPASSLPWPAAATSMRAYVKIQTSSARSQSGRIRAEWGSVRLTSPTVSMQIRN